MRTSTSRGLLALSVTAAAVSSMAVSPASARTIASVSFNLGSGTVAGLQLNSASSSDVKRKLGPPKSSHKDSNMPGVRWMIYNCGRGCELWMQTKNGALVGGWAKTSKGRTFRKVRTVPGTYLGASRSDAERRERKKMTPGCVDSLYKTRGRFSLSISDTMGDDAVDSILLVGRGGGVPC